MKFLANDREKCEGGVEWQRERGRESEWERKICDA